MSLNIIHILLTNKTPNKRGIEEFGEVDTVLRLLPNFAELKKENYEK